MAAIAMTSNSKCWIAAGRIWRQPKRFSAAMSRGWNIMSAGRPIIGSIFSISGLRKNMPPKIAFFCLVLAALPAQAQDSGDTWGMDQLMQKLSQNKGGTVTFSEDKYNAMLTRPLHASGVLVYSPPSRLEKNTLLPK